MKRYKTLIMIILFSLAGGYMIYYICDRHIIRNPIRIIEQVYNIKLDDFNCSVELFEEQWCPNGNGFCTIILKMEDFSSKNDLYLQSNDFEPLPISANLPRTGIPINVAFAQSLKSQKGYYSYKENPEDNRDIDLLIFDLENKKILYYVRIM